MNELFYPTIDLFIYDLRSPLNANEIEIQENKQKFQERLPANVKIKNGEQEEEFLELAEPPSPDLDPKNPSLQGYYYPVLLNDTFGLQIDCSVDNLTDPQPIDSFSSIAVEIEPASHANALTIGKTWLMSGWLAEQNQDTHSTAIECYQALFKDESIPEIWGKGTLFTADIFEIKRSSSPNSDRVIIMLFRDRTTYEKAAEFYTDWMGLFCYRHKITWAYEQSRLIKESLSKHYKQVEYYADIIRNSQKSKINLATLQITLNDIKNILDLYTLDLLKLSFYKQIVDINLANYRERLQQYIKPKAGAESNLEFLDRFGDLAEKKYLTQIDKDNENMQLGLKLLETNINALRSQIELEKSERDLNFQNLVTLVGAGTAITALFDYEGKKCKAIFQVPKDAKNSVCDNFLVGGVVIPIASLLILGGITLLLKWLYIKIKDRSRQESTRPKG